MEHVLLHVEDEPQIRDLVSLAFDSFGFQGQILTACNVKDALALLTERAQQQKPLNLILVDMQLPDGMGLDVIREVKSNPCWRLTPVIVLSGENSRQIINDSYALGANCFFPKVSAKNGIVDSLKMLYDCWLVGAILPDGSFSKDNLFIYFARAVRLRARTARYYAELARAFEDDAEMMTFWLDRSLNEGNFTNLIVFFQGMFSEQDFPASSIQMLREMQDRVESSLRVAGRVFEGTAHPSAEDAFSQVLDIHEAWDEGYFIELIKDLLPQSPVAAKALQALLADHLRKVGAFISERTATPAYKERARTLCGWAEQIEALDKRIRN